MVIPDQLDFGRSALEARPPIGGLASLNRTVFRFIRYHSLPRPL